MRGAIPSLPQYAFMAWCLVKHGDNFTCFLQAKVGVTYRTGRNRLLPNSSGHGIHGMLLFLVLNETNLVLQLKQHR
jgi:hypothetical protein